MRQTVATSEKLPETDPGLETLEVLADAPRFNEWMADTIRPFLGPRVIELGAGIGNLSVQLAAGRERYLASDVDHGRLERLRDRLHPWEGTHVAGCDLQSREHAAQFEENFDSAVCLNVLEHVEDDCLALENIRSMLVPGGRALLLVPEGMSVYGTLDEVLGHYRRYSEAELRAKMERAGLTVERVLEFNRISRPAWFLSGRVFRRRSFSRRQIVMFDRLVWLWRRIDRYLPWRPTSLIAIGVRPR